MKILFFSRLFYPHIGGVERHLLEISRILVKKGHKITIVTEQDSLNAKQRELFEGIEVFRIPNLRNGKLKKFKIWKWLWDNYELMDNADIVHCHDVFFWYLPFRFMFPFKKVFTTFHGYEDFPLKKKSIIIRKISEKLSNGNICIGDFIKKWYGTNPNFVSYGGVKIPDEKLQKKIKIKKSSAVFIGRLDEQTGIKMYAEAYEIIKKKVPDFELIVIGDGSYKNKIPKGIKVLGFKKNPEDYLKEYNFAFVSRYLSILEAMAAKKLIFAVYDNPIKGDYLKLAPFSKYIVISDSASELADKVQYYLKNQKAKEKMIEGAYAWVKNHTWSEMTNTYLNLWKI